MSVARARCVNTSRPWTVLRFTTRLRLPRFTALKLGLSAATPPGICLDESPAGGSTLTTSAPRSARIIAQNGPAITCVTSSTRNPASAVDLVIGLSGYLVIWLSGYLVIWLLELGY